MTTTAADEVHRSRDAALNVLLGPRLEPIVDMVVFSPGADTYEARAIDGAVRYRRRRTASGWTFEVEAVEGRDPLGERDPTRFSPLASESEWLYPERTTNSYPFALDHLSQVFDHPCAPDLFVIHSAAHQYGNNVGQHGSADVVQARAPFVVAGAGVRKLGMVDRHCRLIDVAPTILALLGVEPAGGTGPNGEPRDNAMLSRQDGEVIEDVLEPGTSAEHVVAILLDGCNANVLYDMASRGEAKNVAQLISMGCAFRHGAVASFPTVTLPNHTSLLTGCHPGRHGVLHNSWYDRKLQRRVVTESASTWQEAMRWLRPGVETIHEALKRVRPDSVTVSVNEPADRGADYSTFDLFREDKADLLVPDMSDLPPHTTASFADSHQYYRWWSFSDTVGLRQACAIWGGRHLGVDYPPPTFSWVSSSLTDSAFHAGGPHSEIARASVRDSDARVGDLMRAVQDAGVFDRTVFVVVADHGMEQSDPGVVGDWGDALREAQIPFRDESSGFIYLAD